MIKESFLIKFFEKKKIKKNETIHSFNLIQNAPNRIHKIMKIPNES